MTLFARTFLLVFCQLAVGGLLALSVPPFHEIERGFYKSSAGVFLTAALIGVMGTIYLGLTRAASGVGAIESIVWVAFVILLAIYTASLWGEAFVMRARSYAAALVTGMIALGLSGYSLADRHGPLIACLSVISSLTSAALLGSVTAGMLIGHWYLIDPGMEIDPFRRCFRFFKATLWAQLIAVSVIVGIVLATQPIASDPGDLGGHIASLVLRLALGPIAALRSRR